MDRSPSLACSHTFCSLCFCVSKGLFNFSRRACLARGCKSGTTSIHLQRDCEYRRCSLGYFPDGPNNSPRASRSSGDSRDPRRQIHMEASAWPAHGDRLLGPIYDGCISVGHRNRQCPGGSRMAGASGHRRCGFDRCGVAFWWSDILVDFGPHGRSSGSVPWAGRAIRWVETRQ